MQYNSAVGSSWCLKLVKVASYLFTFLHIKCAVMVLIESHCKIGQQQLTCFYSVSVMTFCTLPHEKFNWLNPLSLWRPCKAWHIGIKIFLKVHLNFCIYPSPFHIFCRFRILHKDISKVIIKKTCREVSLLEQFTIDCEYLAYFFPKIYKRNMYHGTFLCGRYNVFIFHKLKSALFFSIANRPKISPNLIFCSIKMAPCATSI